MRLRFRSATVEHPPTDPRGGRCRRPTERRIRDFRHGPKWTDFRPRGGRSAAGNWRLRPVRGSVRCRSISALRSRRSSNSRGHSASASEVRVAPRNSPRSRGFEEKPTRRDFASSIGWCSPCQPGALRAACCAGLERFGPVTFGLHRKMWANARANLMVGRSAGHSIAGSRPRNSGPRAVPAGARPRGRGRRHRPTLAQPPA
jgi:hypothetical protein